MYSKLFLKYMRNYLGLLGFSLLLLIPVYFTIYQGTKERILNEAYSNLEKGADDLNAHIDKMLIMTDLLYDNEHVRDLMNISGNPKSRDTICLMRAEEFLHNCFLLRVENFHEYLIFRDNDIVISNGTILANVEYQIYDSFGQKGIGFSSFREMIFQNKEKISFLTKTDNDKNSGILGIMKAQDRNVRQDQIALIYHLDSGILNEILGISSIGSTDFAYITNRDNEILYQINDVDVPLELTGEERQEITWNGKKYTVLHIDTNTSGLSWTLGISDKTIGENIANVNRIIIIYIVAAILGMILLCGLCAWKRSRNMNGIMEEMEDLRQSIRNNILAKLFLCGVYSAKEKRKVEECLEWDINYYCVICIRIKKDSEQKSVECFSRMDEWLKKEFRFFSLNNNENERCCLIRFEDERAVQKDHLLGVLHQMLKLLPETKIGVSMTASEIENVRLCYQQAKLMVRQIADLYDVSIKVFEDQGEDKEKIFRLNLETRLYELIHASEKDTLKNLFDKIRSYAGNCNWRTEAQIMQFFYEIQTPIARVWDELDPDQRFEKEVLDYHPAKNVGELIDSLEYASMYLCESISKKREGNKAKFREEMIRFVKDNCCNKDMCVSFGAAHLGLSEKSFAAVFKEQTGKTFGVYVETERMKVAEKYLLETGFSMAEIADKVGYNTLDAFYKSFKKTHGVAPGKWKLMNSEHSIEK